MPAKPFRLLIPLVYLSAAVSMAGSRPLLAQASSTETHTFAVQGGRFALDGKPFQIISGAIHYTRIPREYWRDRLKKAKAMGLNTVETYAFWNVHEPEPGVYDFSGQNDIAEFIREAQEEGLYVVLRPGPYVCAEWEFGGYPAWLLKNHSMVVRSSYPGFLDATSKWLQRLGEVTAPLQIGNGGPIIAVQVENEYGSFGEDHAYMEQIHQMLVKSGFTKSLLYTADGAEQLEKGSLPELPAGINFGSGDAQHSFAILKKLRPEGPFFNSEYWDGWFDHWGEKHHLGNAEQELPDLKWMLSQGYSVNLYMFDGGTSFGWMNGANTNGKNYEPDVTSYDYDVPVGEGGELRPKYFQFRDAIQQVTGKTPPAPPAAIAPITIPAVTLVESASLWTNLPAAIHSAQPLTMEDIGQSYGYILYRTTVNGPKDGVLRLEDVHDYAQVYLDGKLQGVIDRRLDQSELSLRVAGKQARLDILVENSGRVNFGKKINGERTGITKQVLFAGAAVENWEIFSLPMKAPGELRFGAVPCAGACFYRATFDLAKPGDTFLDTRGLRKGEVWINGRALGRFWHVGPQHTLYLPGPWLKQGRNEIVVFDLDGRSGSKVSGLSEPILDGMVESRASAAKAP